MYSPIRKIIQYVIVIQQVIACLMGYPWPLYVLESYSETYSGEGYLYWLIETVGYLPLRETPVETLWKIGVEVDGYGVVDLTHATGSYDIAEDIFDHVEAAMRSGQNSFVIRWAGLEETYSVDLNALARLQLVSEDAIVCVAYAIFQDFSDRFESFQQDQGFPRSLSAWSQEDLPSNHIGFYAYAYYKDEGKSGAIAQTIELLGDDYRGVDMYQNLGRKNYSWNFTDCGLFACATIPWPDTLQISPILESCATWQHQE